MKLSKICFSVIGLFVILSGCSSKKVVKHQKRAVDLEMQHKSDDHKWFYFSDGSYAEIDLPQHSPIHSLKPWTESVRICDGNVSPDGKGILLVNHLGVLYFDSTDNPALIQDCQLFSDSTAGNLVFDGTNPYFTLVKNSFFNKTSSTRNQSHVIRLAENQKMFFPTVTYGDLNLPENSEVSGTYFDGENWFSSIKSTDGDKVSFKYIKWNTQADMASLSPTTHDGKVSISQITEASYRKVNSPSDFSKAPVRLKNLLSSIPRDFAFTVICQDAGGNSPRYFENGSDDDGTFANAIIKDNWICAVFSDGTTYFCGGLDGKPLINNGRNIAFRLPKLPKDYSYESFAISGRYLIVAWEESDFYKTGRSGFLTVDMEKLFYTK